MRVQLTTDRVGPGCTDSAGDVVDVGPLEGRRLIESGQAVEVHDEGERRTAAVVVETNMTAPAAEQTAARVTAPAARPVRPPARKK